MSKFIIKDGFIEKYVGIEEEVVIVPGDVRGLSDDVFGDVEETVNKVTKKVVFSNGIKSIGGLQTCVNLEEVVIPESVESISLNLNDSIFPWGNLKSPYSNDNDVNRNDVSVYITNLEAWLNIMFYNECEASYPYNLYLNGELLTELVIPENVTKINPYAFTGCVSLKKVYIHKNVESIGKGAFFNCAKLESVLIENGVKLIEAKAFEDIKCKEILIPKSVEKIEEWALCSLGEVAFDRILVVSPNTQIAKNAIYKYALICAPKASHAEKYAKENDIKFEELNEYVDANGEIVTISCNNDET